MNKKHFVLVLIGIIALIILSFTLQTLFNDQIQNLELACISFSLSIFCLFCYKDALKPTEKGIGRPVNMTKKHYERKGELHKYQNLCKILFIVTISYGALMLFFGFGDLLFTYLKYAVFI